jgi:hypothetical protein
MSKNRASYRVRIFATASLLCVQDALFSWAGGWLAATAVATETGARPDGDASLFAPGGEALAAFAVAHTASVPVIAGTAIPFLFFAFLAQVALRARLFPGGSRGDRRFFPFVGLAALQALGAAVVAAVGAGVAALVITASTRNPVQGIQIALVVAAPFLLFALALFHTRPLAEAMWLYDAENTGLYRIFSAYAGTIRRVFRQPTLLGGLLLPLAPGAVATVAALGYAAQISPTPSPVLAGAASVLAAFMLRFGRAYTWDFAQKKIAPSDPPAQPSEGEAG